MTSRAERLGSARPDPDLRSENRIKTLLNLETPLNPAMICP